MLRVVLLNSRLWPACRHAATAVSFSQPPPGHRCGGCRSPARDAPLPCLTRMSTETSPLPSWGWSSLDPPWPLANQPTRESDAYGVISEELLAWEPVGQRGMPCKSLHPVGDDWKGGTNERGWLTTVGRPVGDRLPHRCPPMSGTRRTLTSNARSTTPGNCSHFRTQGVLLERPHSPHEVKSTTPC